MAHITADRVKDTTTTTGTGALALSGSAPSSFVTFSAVCAVNDTCDYAIEDPTNGAWETGVGTYSSANTLTRTTVRASSNANAAVSLAAGTKVVMLTPIAHKAGAWISVFGDGIDGDATIAGATTLTRDMYYNDLTVNASAAVNTAGYRLFVAGKFDIGSAPAGSFYYRGSVGNNATGATSGAGTSRGIVGNTVGGSQSLNSASVGNGGTGAGTNGSNTGSNGEAGGNGGDGGKGGAANGGATAGGTAATAVAQTQFPGFSLSGVLGQKMIQVTPTIVECGGNGCSGANGAG